MADSLSGRAVRHPALQSGHGLSSDIFPQLFDWFFTHPVFERWYSREGSYQLHCIGAPGTGKTTLAALVANHIKEKRDTGVKVVISIFIDRDVIAYETAFLEDFLLVIYQNLEKIEIDSETVDTEDSESYYDDYIQARFVTLEGSRVSRRVNLIRKAVFSRISSLTKSVRIYLILDGAERCNSTLKLLLETELVDLQQKGISIFVTSRLAVFEQVEALCDHPNHRGAGDDEELDEDDLEVLDLYYVCGNDDQVMCFPCREAGRFCGQCDTIDALREEYDHVNISMTSIPSESMRHFITWNLEREHGDLKLGSSARKPPLSPLGISLLADKSIDRPEKLVNDLIEDALGNVALAKARLDIVHSVESVEDLDARRDWLPPNIVAMFNAGLRHIEAQPLEQRDLGLKVIAAAGRNFGGLSVPRIQEMLQGAISAELRSGEDLLEAVKGFLLASTGDEIQKLVLYHRDFYRFAKDRYHVGIHRADSALTEHLRRRRSSLSITAPHEPKVRFEPRTVSDDPTAITPFKLWRTMTAKEPIEEAPTQAFILRKGTRAWR